MVEQFANNATTTLNGGITSSATTLVVTSASAFPTSPQFRIIIDTEVLLVTGVSSNTFTVSRGQEGTTAISHLSGATVSQILTNGAIQQFRADNIQVGTFASRPAVGLAGRIYRTTDGNILFIDTGSTWSPFGPTMPLVQPPAASNFSVIQTAGNGSIVDDAGGLYLSATQNTTTEDIIFAAQSNPGGTGAAYTLTVGFIPIPGGKAGTAGFFNYHITGVGLYRTATTENRTMVVYTQGDGSFRFQLRGTTGLRGTMSNTFDIGGYPLISGPMIWFRIQDDGTTNRTWSISTDGRHFKPLTIETRTTGFSTGQPDKIGPMLSPFNADAQMTILSYQLTSP